MILSNLKNNAGFTLIELLVVLAIIAILTSVGIPSYNKFVESGRFSHGYNNFYNAYRFARAEAIKTSSAMVINAEGGDWNLGWEVYAQASSAVKLLKFPPVKQGVSISAAGATSITVLGRGSVSATGVTAVTVTGVSKEQKICILQSGQSYKQPTGSC